MTDVRVTVPVQLTFIALDTVISRRVGYDMIFIFPLQKKKPLYFFLLTAAFAREEKSIFFHFQRKGKFALRLSGLLTREKPAGTKLYLASPLERTTCHEIRSDISRGYNFSWDKYKVLKVSNRS